MKVVLCFSCCVGASHAFRQRIIMPKVHRRINFSLLFSTIENEPNLIGREQLEHDRSNSIDLWLDLRGTSLTPESVLKLWELEERDGQVNTSFVSKYLMSST